MHRNHQDPSSMRRGMREGAAARRVRRLVSLRRGGRPSLTALFVHLMVAITLGAGLLMPLTEAGQALANPGFEPQPARTPEAGARTGWLDGLRA